MEMSCQKLLKHGGFFLDSKYTLNEKIIKAKRGIQNSYPLKLLINCVRPLEWRRWKEHYQYALVITGTRQGSNQSKPCQEPSLEIIYPHFTELCIEIIIVILFMM